MDDIAIKTAVPDATPPRQTEKAEETPGPESFIDDLDAQGDDILRALVAQASAILEGRAGMRRREAIDEIKRLARENGLTVSVRKPAGKRGRPRKSEPAGA